MFSFQTAKINKEGLKVIKLEFILRLRIKRNDWLLADTCRVRKQPVIALYFEAETEIKFYNLEAKLSLSSLSISLSVCLSVGRSVCLPACLPTVRPFVRTYKWPLIGKNHLYSSSLSLSVCLSVGRSVGACLPAASLPVRQYLQTAPCWENPLHSSSLSISICMSFCRSVCMPVCLSAASPPIRPYKLPNVGKFTYIRHLCLSLCLPVCLSVRSSTRLKTSNMTRKWPIQTHDT